MQTQTQPQVQTPIPAAATLPANLRRLVLTGFMGAGKTTVGCLLARHLGWEFLDLDLYLESRVGLTVPEIFSTHGEARFRQLESNALASALGRSNVIVALGGGTPEGLTNRLLLEQTPGTATVFLQATFATLYDRCILQALNPGTTERPLLADPLAAEQRFAARLPIYRRLARVTVPTGDTTPEETVAALLTSLNATAQKPAARALGSR